MNTPNLDKARLEGHYPIVAVVVDGDKVVVHAECNKHGGGEKEPVVTTIQKFRTDLGQLSMLMALGMFPPILGEALLLAAEEVGIKVLN